MARRFDCTYRFRLSAADRIALGVAAAEAGCSAAEVVRRAAQSVPARDAETRAEIASLRRQLNGLGSNLNQLIHMAHSGQLDIDAIQTTIATIAAMRAEVSEALRR